MCRYIALGLGVAVYIWQWFGDNNPIHQNLLMLQEIQQDIDKLNKRVTGALQDTPNKIRGGDPMGGKYGSVLGPYAKAFTRYSEPPLSPGTKWRVDNYSE